MTSKAHIAHMMPGRLRIRVPAARGNPELLEQTRALFNGVAGLRKVTMKPDSGSIVLHYDPVQAAAVEAELWQRWKAAKPSLPRKPRREHAARPGDEISEVTRQIEAEAEFLAGRSETARLLVQFFKDFDAEVKRLTSNTVDLKILLALGLAVVTFIGVGAHAATPMWVTLVLFALNHFLEMHPTSGNPAPAGAPVRA